MNEIISIVNVLLPFAIGAGIFGWMTAKVSDQSAPLTAEWKPRLRPAKIWRPIMICLGILFVCLLLAALSGAFRPAGAAGYHDSEPYGDMAKESNIAFLIGAVIFAVIGGLSFVGWLLVSNEWGRLRKFLFATSIIGGACAFVSLIMLMVSGTDFSSSSGTAHVYALPVAREFASERTASLLNLLASAVAIVGCLSAIWGLIGRYRGKLDLGTSVGLTVGGVILIIFALLITILASNESTEGVTRAAHNALPIARPVFEPIPWWLNFYYAAGFVVLGLAVALTFGPKQGEDNKKVSLFRWLMFWVGAVIGFLGATLLLVQLYNWAYGPILGF